MKTHVRTKLGWSKLVLISAVIAAVAMLSVMGLCFTNANADNSVESEPVPINIPVSILDHDAITSAICEVTPWGETPSEEFTTEGEFEGLHTYTVGKNDTEHPWLDEQSKSSAFVSGNALVIQLATDDSSSTMYKKWRI